MENDYLERREINRGNNINCTLCGNSVRIEGGGKRLANVSNGRLWWWRYWTAGRWLSSAYYNISHRVNMRNYT